MRQADAEAIASWRYPDEYSFYDWTSDPDDLAKLQSRCGDPPEPSQR